MAVKSFPQSGEKKAYTQTHVSFQSTGSTNISSVNALNSNQLFVVKKERGTGAEKRKWAVEMNDARILYLSYNCQVNNTDGIMARCCLHYSLRKYWHSAGLHALTLAITTAYNIYLECTKGLLDPTWKVVTPMTFHKFRDRLSCQMNYKPRFTCYPGDVGF
ncbi:unnamed protein product [Cylindrotheca closterium]|uniref:Uncharacterized protein n=1 Tax=Cylindrotheca closterium TaxID=2856 RepID=A0AAD2CRR1_9STRA|nr:unnamed protein product [Cylindrotheca closterium]